MTNKYNIALIGCGKMGGAMIQGWVGAGLVQTAEILDPNEVDESVTSHDDLFHVKLMESLSVDKMDVIILAVKPQIAESVCRELESYLKSNQLVISIAAGKSLGFFEDVLGLEKPIIRAMPNTPAAIGKGANVLCASDNVTDAQRKIAQDLFDASGQTHWVDDESLMNAVTALSGSGPAYVFYMVEAMTQAGVHSGLPQELAYDLARQTVIGSAALMEEEHDTHASVLRQNVTSPKGTTEAGLKELMNGIFQERITSTIEAAKKRGEELND